MPEKTQSYKGWSPFFPYISCPSYRKRTIDIYSYKIEARMLSILVLNFLTRSYLGIGRMGMKGAIVIHGAFLGWFWRRRMDQWKWYFVFWDIFKRSQAFRPWLGLLECKSTSDLGQIPICRNRKQPTSKILTLIKRSSKVDLQFKMDFEQTIIFLKNGLKKPLPGQHCARTNYVSPLPMVRGDSISIFCKVLE